MLVWYLYNITKYNLTANLRVHMQIFPLVKLKYRDPAESSYRDHSVLLKLKKLLKIK